MKYRVVFKVLADFDTIVEADSKEEAKILAKSRYSNTSLGDFEFLDELGVEIEKI